MAPPGDHTKAFTLRLSAEQAKRVETMAAVNQRSINQELMEAVNAYIDARFADPAFKQQLKAWIDEQYEQLAEYERMEIPPEQPQGQAGAAGTSSSEDV